MRVEAERKQQQKETADRQLRELRTYYEDQARSHSGNSASWDEFLTVMTEAQRKPVRDLEKGKLVSDSKMKALKSGINNMFKAMAEHEQLKKQQSELLEIYKSNCKSA